jgi:glycosyltransferase involved in cell wall biosynthesis
MIAKLPTIATRVNGMPEVLGNTGFLVEPRHPEQLAEAMLKAYQASLAERTQWGEAGYQRAQEEFSIPRFGEVMGALL